MAEFRQIHTRIWKDDWFSELSQDAKLLFVYLFSNEQAEVGGVYELPIKYMSFETGIPQNRITELIVEFENSKKVYYRNGWVWVVNLRKYNESGSVKVSIRINKDLASLPDGELKEMYCKYYGIPYRYPIDTVSIPDTEKKQGIDTIPIPICTETETEIETDNDTSPSPYSQMSALIATKLKIGEYTGGAKRWISSVQQIYDAKAKEIDIDYAIKWMDEHDRAITGPWSIVNPVIIAASQRERGNGHKPEQKRRARGMAGLV
jgi:hypothetical protein